MTDISDAISELRAADERNAPSFDATLAHKPRRLVLDVQRLAIAATVVIAIGMLASYAKPFSRQPRLVVPAEVIALSTWRSPTESLLDISTSQFYSATQNMDSSFSASRISSVKLTNSTKGDRK